VAAWRRAHEAGTQTVRAALFPPLAEWRMVADTVAARGPGDDRLRLAGVKGYVDGSLGSTTALFFEPYQDDPRTMGLLVTPADSLRTWILAADSAQLQVVVHAIGERANSLLLDIYELAARTHGARDRRFRIEHAQHLRESEMNRLAQDGVIASMQAIHLSDDGRWAAKRIRPDQVARTYAFRSLLDRKVRLAFGSDWPVAPIEPLRGVWAAVTRQTNDGRNPEGWTPEQKISVEEALRAYTVDNAYGVFAEGVRGRLVVGAKADLVLLGEDLTRIAPDRIKDVPVKATIMGGRVVFRAE
jgi:predicted amidohydrolase YtcJ